MRVVIVDDEPLAREGLRMLLAEHPDTLVVGEAGDGREAAALIDAVRPDLALLDIEMPELDGLALALGLAPATAPALVFVTAHDAHAVRAFEAMALDYVLKPVAPERLARALARARDRLHTHDAAAQLARLRAAVHARADDDADDRVCVRVGPRRVLLAWHEIDWIEAADYYVELHVGAHGYLHRESLARLEPRLEAAGFVRIHRARMVNGARIRELCGHGRSLRVVLASGVALEVARRCQARVRAVLERRGTPGRRAHRPGLL